MTEPPRDPLEILVGILLILFGACITLVGGGCTFLWIGEIRYLLEYGSIFLLLASTAILALGLFSVWRGIRMLTRRRPRE